MNPRELLNELVGWLKDTVEGSIKKLFEDNTNKIVDSINDQEKTNPQDITNPINKKLDEVKNSVDGLEFPEYPEQIDNRENIDELGEKLDLLVGEIEKLNPNVTINNDFKELIDVIIKSNDKTKVVNTLSLIKKELSNKKDYTSILEEISSKIEASNDSEMLIEKLSKLENLGIIIEYLQALLEKPVPSFEEFLSKEGRIKVEVDRVGQGGGGGIAGTYNKDLEQVNPATEEKQDDAISELQDIAQNTDTLPSSIGSFRVVVTTAGTPVQLSVASVPCKRIEICAGEGNAGAIVYGGSDVVADQSTRKGTPLYPLDAKDNLQIDNLNKIYIDSTQDGDEITGNYYA